jgi:hypothetical protein
MMTRDVLVVSASIFKIFIYGSPVPEAAERQNKIS